MLALGRCLPFYFQQLITAFVHVSRANDCSTFCQYALISHAHVFRSISCSFFLHLTAVS